MTPKEKAIKAVKKLGILVKELPKNTNIDNRYNIKHKDEFKVTGQWKQGRTIYIGDGASSYTILHEAGHALNGYMCCLEHCEYAAHGAAIALAKVFNIPLPRGAKKLIDIYAGCSARKACGAINP